MSMTSSGLTPADTDSDGARRRTAIASIYDQLRQRICTVAYPYGTILREKELAAECGISRTPVREALQRLQNDGLVETRHGVGSFVIAGDPASMEDIYALRIELAGLIGRMSEGGCGPAAVATMRDLVERVHSLHTTPDRQAFWEINEARHQVINGLIRNRELAGLHDLYYHKVAPFWFRLFADGVPDEVDLLERELRETLFWIEADDLEAVAAVHRNYIAFGLARVRRAMPQRTAR